MSPDEDHRAPRLRAGLTAADATARLAGTFGAGLGVEVVSVVEGEATCRLAVRPEHANTNGVVHGGVIVTLADVTCGAGTIAHLPADATAHTTTELKVNYLRAATGATLLCTARLRHWGRSTQVWDAEVVDEETASAIALFRCTQMLLRDSERG